MNPETMSKTHAKTFVLHKLLSESYSAYVHLDSRRKGVVVPKELLGRPQLVLQLGMNLVVPLTDFKMSPEGWSATLSFGRRPFHCTVPWEAIYLIVNDDGMGAVWAEDAPTEVDIPGQEKRDPTPAAVEKRKTLPPGWRVVEGGKTSDGEDRRELASDPTRSGDAS